MSRTSLVRRRKPAHCRRSAPSVTTRKSTKPKWIMENVGKERDCRERLQEREFSDDAAEGGEERIEGRERLQKHRMMVAGKVWIPETWGQEELLKEWVDCGAIDRSLMPNGLVSARNALVEECRRAGSSSLEIDLTAS
ncbi:hypothetical protein AMTRI_Chr11g96670 [Amborella trichopoda]|uniref:Uncharacterized protein n=1 Tax=Amborella trichopoda TaxID=13333 RepID=W1NFD6_AMBTC|nr:protein BIC1 [Amborella trichopoda]ERM93885.1 hypothetical protein AMTR_s00139p00102470 [Amborella trichopoda]|eukprot:XP_006826648.1 protein BIC1 [Amborella trichopoda]